MPTAMSIRTQIEHALEARFPAALTPQPRVLHEVSATGIDPIDALLSGGLPVGAVSELTGPASSGRTTLALSFLAQRTAEGRVCAWVDVDDTLDPASAAANGVVLAQLLWIHCCDEALSANCNSSRAEGASLVGPALGRGEIRESSIQSPEKDGGLGSHSANCFRAHHKFGDDSRKRQRAIWSRLDQALRATDLLLQAGGFAAIVLDLASTAPEHARRIPLATWFRYRQAADRTRTSVIVLSKVACAQSSAAVVLECAPLRPQAQSTILRGFSGSARRGRQRFTPIEIGTGKPPLSTWSAAAQWQQEKRA